MSQAVGLFDSGVGGLSVMHEVRRQLPNETLYYVADTAHVPYGAKSEAFIRARAFEISHFLLRQEIKALVIACNTATAAAAAALRAALSVPVIAMEPAVKPAAAATRSGIVGVLATAGTLQSAQFAALLERYSGSAQFITQPCPGLPEQVEAGELSSARTRALIRTYTAPLLAAGADTLVLGCTHYAFLRTVIRQLVGPEVTLIDTGAAVARQLGRVLGAERRLASPGGAVAERFWTSGDPAQGQRVLGSLWRPGALFDPLP